MKNYPQTVQYIFKLQHFGIKPGLENIRLLLNTIGNPQTNFAAIHVAGTNGKGSTSAIMESILLKAGYKVGLYTSPHLIDFRERMRVNQNYIPEKVVIDFTQKLLPLIETLKPSFFEVTTALAFWYFAQEAVDVAIIETGMGGRLDATNIIVPLISVITTISYDHQKYLGKTLEKITGEKGGIIKKGVPCITNNRNAAVLKKIFQICQEKNSSLLNIFDNNSYEVLLLEMGGTKFNLKLADCVYKNLYLNLSGDYQLENMLLATATLGYLKENFDIPYSAYAEGLECVLWKGRIHLLSKTPVIIVDVSHNPSGFEKTLLFIKNFFSKEHLKAIISLQNDKDYQKIANLLVLHVNEIVIPRLYTGTPLDPCKLLTAVQDLGGKARIIDSFIDVKDEIYDPHMTTAAWIIIGSHYLAGEAYANL